jgi:hypothetical protein
MTNRAINGKAAVAAPQARRDATKVSYSDLGAARDGSVREAARPLAAGGWRKDSRRRSTRERRASQRAKTVAVLAIWLLVGGVVAHLLGRAIGDPIAGTIVALLLSLVVAPFILRRDITEVSGRRRDF